MVVAVQSVFATIGIILIGAGSLGAAAFWMFRLLSEKWLTAKFNERLAAYKHEQQKELEELRFRINTLLDRVTKLHQREFDVLPEVWGRLNDAFNKVRPVSLGLVEYPDVNRLTPDQLENLLKESQLAEWQKNELRAATDKNSYYGRAIEWRQFVEAWNCWVEFHAYLTKGGIFIPESVKAKFAEFDDLLHGALFERKFALEHRDIAPKFDKGAALHEKGPALLKSLERDVQQRLWNAEAAS